MSVRSVASVQSAVRCGAVWRNATQRAGVGIITFPEHKRASEFAVRTLIQSYVLMSIHDSRSYPGISMRS